MRRREFLLGLGGAVVAAFAAGAALQGAEAKGGDPKAKVEALVRQMEAAKAREVSSPAGFYDVVLAVARAGDPAAAHRYMERVRAITNLSFNAWLQTHELDARTYNLEKRHAETKKLYDRLLTDPKVQAKAYMPGLVSTAAKLVRGTCPHGWKATFDLYEKVLADPKKYRLDGHGLKVVASAYGQRAWMSMDRPRMAKAIAFNKSIGDPYPPNSDIMKLMRRYEEMDAFPKDEKELGIPTDARQLGFDPDRKVVKASSFGWNATNATDCLQKALDSDASTVVVDDMGSPWYIWTVHLNPGPCSNRKIVFAKGVRVLSAPETQDQKSPSWFRNNMFQSHRCTNLWMEAEGELGKDVYIGKYRNRKERFATGYQYGGCGIHGGFCNSVFKNLWVANCGQDAFALGGHHIYIVDCIMDDNYRQGMSLGGSTDCVYKNVTFCNTLGGEPHCGIDFEPGYPVSDTSNHYFLDCTFFNNASKNVMFAISTFAPVTVHFKRCTFKAQENGNVAFFARSDIYTDAFEHAPSKIVFDDCRIDGHSDGNGNPIQFLSGVIFDVLFRNCVINDCGPRKPGAAATASPILITFDRTLYDGFYPHAGVVTFENVKVNGYADVPMVSVNDANGRAGYRSFRGTIDWNGKPVDMSKFSFLSPERGRGDSPEPDLAKLSLPEGLATPWTPSFAFYFQHAYYLPRPNYVYYCRGERGREAVFRLDYTCDLVAKQPPVKVIAPDGAVTALGMPKRGENEFRYVFPSDGLFTFDFNQECDMSRDWSAPEGYRLLSAKGVRPAYQSLQTPEGRFVQITLGKTFPGYTGYFEVPGGRECMIKMMGGGGLEIRNARGELVCSHRATCDYDSAKCLSFRSDSAENEIWSFTVLDRWVRFRFFDPLPGIWADDPADLPTVAGGKLAFCRRAVAAPKAAAAETAAAGVSRDVGAWTATVSNVTERVAAERAATAKKGATLALYRQAEKTLGEIRKHPDGDGARKEIEDLGKLLERTKTMAELEERAQRETPEECRAAAFCDKFCPVLVLTDEEAAGWIRHLENPKDDLEKSNPALYRKVNSPDYDAALQAAVAKYGCGYLQFVFTCGSFAQVAELRAAIERRIRGLKRP